MPSDSFRIISKPGELNEGLFGQIVLWTFEVLPYLKSRSLHPDWEITSKLYGTAPDFTVLPGVFDLAYKAPAGPVKDVDFYALRSSDVSILGNDWKGLHDLC